MTAFARVSALAVLLMAVAYGQVNWNVNPLNNENLKIGGGYGDTVDGGLDVDKSGNLWADGSLRLKGVLITGSGAHQLTNTAGLLDGLKLQDGTVGTPALTDPLITPGSLKTKGNEIYIGNATAGNKELRFETNANPVRFVYIPTAKDMHLGFSGTTDRDMLILYIGNEDTNAGRINLFGRGAGQQFGGALQIETAADHDDVVNYYGMVTNGNTLDITAAGNTMLMLRGAESPRKVDVTGELRAFGNATTVTGIDRYNQATGSVSNVLRDNWNLRDDAGNDVTAFRVTASLNNIGASTKNSDIFLSGFSNNVFTDIVRLNGNNVTFANDTTAAGDVAINGGDLTSAATSFNLLNSTVTTLNLGGAATALTLGATSGTTTIRNNLAVSPISGVSTIGTGAGEARLDFVTDRTTGANAAFRFLSDGGSREVARMLDNGNVNIGGHGSPTELFTVGSTSQFAVTSGGAISAATGITSTGTINLTSATTRIATGTPASSSASGTAGTIQYDADYIYIATGTNAWKRVAISSW